MTTYNSGKCSQKENGQIILCKKNDVVINALEQFRECRDSDVGWRKYYVSYMIQFHIIYKSHWIKDRKPIDD